MTSDDEPPRGEGGIPRPAMDVAVALVVLALGLLVAIDSWRLGARWGDDGPQSGYFPFYIGSLLCLSALGTLAQAGLDEWKRRGHFKGAIHEHRRTFVGWSALRQVLAVLVPATIYVLLVQLVGFYVASALYIAAFMIGLGRYAWWKSAAIGVGTSAVLFAMFEIWFKVPLYKGAWDLLAPLGY